LPFRLFPLLFGLPRRGEILDEHMFFFPRPSSSATPPGRGRVDAHADDHRGLRFLRIDRTQINRPPGIEAVDDIEQTASV
jgi:hypothetical protein